MMNNGTHLSSSGSKMASKVKKIAVPRLKKIKVHCYYIKTQDDALFKNRSKISAFLLSPLKSMLDSEVDRLSLQKL